MKRPTQLVRLSAGDLNTVDIIIAVGCKSSSNEYTFLGEDRDKLSVGGYVFES